MSHKRYLKEPDTISWAKAKSMKRVPRGVWVEPRVGRPKSARQLGIKVTENGVKVPGHKKQFKSLATAIRAQGHKLSSIEEREQDLEKAQEVISELHGRIQDNWNQMSKSEQGKVISEVATLRNKLSPLESSAGSLSESMSKALSDLDEAVAEGNSSRLRAKLVQVHNDITDRRGELRGQLANIPRWRDALAAEKRARDIEAFEHIDTVHNMIKSAREGDDAERLRVVEGAKSLGQRLTSANARNLKATARRRLEKAAGLLESGNVTDGVEQLRAANQSIASHISNHSWLYSWRLDQIAKASDKDAKSKRTGRADRFRKDIVKRQTRLYAQNLEYWLSPASHEPINEEIAAGNLEALGAFFPKSSFQRRMKSAAGFLRKGKTDLAKARIEEARKELT
jgi:hypothetical protein